MTYGDKRYEKIVLALFIIAIAIAIFLLSYYYTSPHFLSFLRLHVL